jgi:hypothetical protein
MKLTYEIRNFKKLGFAFLTFFVAFTTLQCADPEWLQVYNSTGQVHTIYFPPNTNKTILFSLDAQATDLDSQPISFPLVGSGYKITTNDFATLSDAHLNEYIVFDIVEDPVETNKWYAAARTMNRGGIAYSKNSGESWEIAMLKCEDTYQPIKIDFKESISTNYFCACVNTAKGFLFSNNGFETCTNNISFDVQARDIAISPADNRLMFLAADGVYASGVFRSYDNGATWLPSESGITNEMKVVAVMPSSTNPAVVVCGVQGAYGGIYKSLDTGRTWSKVQGPATVYGFSRHRTIKSVIAAACGTDYVWISGNDGNTWSLAWKGGDISNMDVYKVSISPDASIANTYTIYAAVRNKGIYKSNNIYTDVEEQIDNGKPLTFISVTPQPANDHCFLTWYNPVAQQVRIELIDCLGNVIKTIDNTFFDAGAQTTDFIFDSDIPQSLYFVVIKTNEQSVIQKLIISK